MEGVMLLVGVIVGFFAGVIVEARYGSKVEATIKELTERLAELKIGALVVSKDGKSVDGIVSERDIVRAIPLNFATFQNLHVRCVHEQNNVFDFLSLV